LDGLTELYIHNNIRLDVEEIIDEIAKETLKTTVCFVNDK